MNMQFNSNKSIYQLNEAIPEISMYIEIKYKKVIQYLQHLVRSMSLKLSLSGLLFLIIIFFIRI